MGSRVLVTGGAGFIGHHLVRALTESGSEVLVVDDLSTGRPDRLRPDIRLECLDLSRVDVGSVVKSWRPRSVFHLAAQASVPRSEADPERDLAVNGLGTLRVAAAARAAGIERLVFASSGGAIYGETADPATEDSPGQPKSFYGAHKLLGEMYVRASGVPHAIARPSNVYGRGQKDLGEGAVVAAFVNAARSGTPLAIHGDGRQLRDFVHVEDVVEALLLLEAAPDSGTWNVASGTSISILHLAEVVEAVSGRHHERRFAPARPADINTSRISAARLMSRGWVPRVTLRQGLGGLLVGD